MACYGVLLAPLLVRHHPFLSPNFQITLSLSKKKAALTATNERLLLVVAVGWLHLLDRERKKNLHRLINISKPRVFCYNQKLKGSSKGITSQFPLSG